MDRRCGVARRPDDFGCVRMTHELAGARRSLVRTSLWRGLVKDHERLPVFPTHGRAKLEVRSSELTLSILRKISEQE